MLRSTDVKSEINWKFIFSMYGKIQWSKLANISFSNAALPLSLNEIIYLGDQFGCQLFQRNPMIGASELQGPSLQWLSYYTLMQLKLF